jgi:prepilin-type N-terminal cleavage/methylation domain-containing protein
MTLNIMNIIATKFHNKNKHIKGFSLVELVIVLVITSIILSTIAFRTSGAISNMSAEVVLGELALAVYETKESAVSGSSDLSKTTFNLNQALVRPHDGVTVTTTAIIGNNNCSSGCEGNNDGSDSNSKTGEIASICVSGNSFCYTPSESFTFERFSGRLNQSHAIFINSNKRKLAILITQSGDHYVAELINNTWQTQRDLQRLFPRQKNNTVKQGS